MNAQDALAAAEQAVVNLGRQQLTVTGADRLNENSNVWQIHCRLYRLDINLNTYLFPEFSIEEATGVIQERLETSLNQTKNQQSG